MHDQQIVSIKNSEKKTTTWRNGFCDLCEMWFVTGHLQIEYIVYESLKEYLTRNYA